MLFDCLLRDVHFLGNFPLREAVKFLQLKRPSALVRQCGDNVLQLFEFLSRTDSALQAGLLAGEAEFFDFSHPFHGNNSCVPSLFENEIADHRVQIAPAVGDVPEVRAP